MMMIMRMILDAAMDVHVVRDYVTGLYSTLTIIIYPGVNQAREIQTPAVLVNNLSNTLKFASVKWMKLDCVAPVFPLEPIAHSTLGRTVWHQSSH